MCSSTRNHSHQILSSQCFAFVSDGPGVADISVFHARYTSDIISTKAEYGVIPPEHWYQPEWIDEERAAKGRLALQQKQVRSTSPILSPDVN